jgi:peptide/nickel transport system substrate-binding protein
LRQATVASLDRQAIIDKVMFGQVMRSSIIPPSAVPFVLSQEEISHLPFHKQDYDLAKKLLKEAGYPNGFEFTISVSPRGEYIAHAEIIQQQLSKVGIKAKIKQIEWGAFQKIVRRGGNFEANIFGGAWKPDPAGYFYGYMHSKARASEIGLNDPEMDRLMKLCLTTPDLETRKDYFKLLQYWAAEKAIAPMSFAGPSRFELVNKRIGGYRFMANNGRIYLRQAWIKK